MQVFNTFFKITKKQISSGIIYIGIFLILVNLIGNLKANEKVDYTDTKCKITVFDYDNTEESKHLKEYLESVHTVKDIEDDEDAILDSMYLQNVDYVLYICEGYSKTGELKNVKRPGSIEGKYVDDQIKNYENSMKALVAAGYDYEIAYEKTVATYNADDLVTMYQEKSEKKPVYYHIFLYIPYAAGMVMFEVLGLVIIAVNRKSVSDRTSVSSTTIKSRNIQVALASIVLTTMIWLIFVVFAIFNNAEAVFKGKAVLNFLNSYIYLIAVAGIVFIIGNFNMKAQSVSMVANIYCLGSSFLGGLFVPMEFFSNGMMKIARFMPTYWYVKAEDAIFDSESISKILGYIGVEVLFAFVFFTIAMVVSKQMKLTRQA